MQTQADRDDFGDRHLYPNVTESRQLDERLRKGLNRDLIWSSLMNVPALIDDLHRPILEKKIELHEDTDHDQEAVAGARALHLWAPNFTGLPWDRIIELHDHAAIGAFRAKLIEAEETVAELAADERETALRDIGYREVLHRAAELTPDYRGVATDLAAGAIVDLIPWGGAILTAATGLARVREAQSDWTAVLLALNRP